MVNTAKVLSRQSQKIRMPTISFMTAIKRRASYTPTSDHTRQSFKIFNIKNIYVWSKSPWLIDYELLTLPNTIAWAELNPRPMASRSRTAGGPIRIASSPGPMKCRRKRPGTMAPRGLSIIEHRTTPGSAPRDTARWQWQQTTMGGSDPAPRRTARSTSVGRRLCDHPIRRRRAGLPRGFPAGKPPAPIRQRRHAPEAPSL